MKNRKILFTILGIAIIGVLVLISIKYLPPQKSPPIELNEEKIECYENMLYFIYNDANITADELNVQNVRCSQEEPYGQWEMTGAYFENNDRSKEPKPFYFQEIRGGDAASGADGYYEICLIIGNQDVISQIAAGRYMNYKSPARCSWQPKLP